MVEENEPKWKRFEKIVAKIQKEFSPNATVTHNDKIVGRRSGVERQIDISIRQSIGQFELLIVIECKDYKIPIDVKGVEEFFGLLDDVAANKGALVSSNGFTDAARNRASEAGVDIYSLVDTENLDWKPNVAIPFVCDFRGFGMCRYKIGGTISICKELSHQDISRVEIYNKDHIKIGTPLTLLWAMWNQRKISPDPGIGKIRLEPNPIFVKNNSDEFERIEIIAEFEVVKKLYFGKVPLTKVSGFIDEGTGKLIIPGNTEIITDFIDSFEVERTWLRIPTIDSLVIKPFMLLEAFDIYPSTIPKNYKPYLAN